MAISFNNYLLDDFTSTGKMDGALQILGVQAAIVMQQITAISNYFKYELITIYIENTLFLKLNIFKCNN